MMLFHLHQGVDLMDRTNKRMNQSQDRFLFFVVVMSLALGACAQPTQATRQAIATDATLYAKDLTGVPNVNQLEIRFSSGTRSSLSLGYDRDAAHAKLAADAAQPAAAVIGEGDIEGYGWERQAIVLTKPATERLMAELAAKEPWDLQQRAFEVTLGGAFVYGGIFLDPVSAMAIAYPVAYLERTEGRLVLVLRPEQRVSGAYDGIGADWNGIKSPAIRERLSQIGKLVP